MSASLRCRRLLVPQARFLGGFSASFRVRSILALRQVEGPTPHIPLVDRLWRVPAMPCVKPYRFGRR